MSDELSRCAWCVHVHVGLLVVGNHIAVRPHIGSAWWRALQCLNNVCACVYVYGRECDVLITHLQELVLLLVELLKLIHSLANTFLLLLGRLGTLQCRAQQRLKLTNTHLCAKKC